MSVKVLFILKRRQDYCGEKHSVKGLSTGLFNSASFMDQMLNDAGVESALEVAIDNNCIDRMVRNHKPTHVIIEALWVVPEKFEILSKLHPNVKWIIRLHSEMPFMANEGMAMDWLGDYLTFPNLYIGVNAPRMLGEIRTYFAIRNNWSDEYVEERVVYMPNFYPQDYKRKWLDRSKEHVDISCFGAVRPLKNHLLQAFAALKFADRIGKKLHFHINSGRIEMKGDPVMNNLRGLFEQLAFTGHKLIGHEWVPREPFLDICAQMDIGMQCNFSETFNIVSADLLSQGVPLVTCTEIPWASRFSNANAADSEDMYYALVRAYYFPQVNVWLNQRNLTKYTNHTRNIWLKYFRGQCDE